MAVSDRESNSGRRPGGPPSGARAHGPSLVPAGKHAGKPPISIKRPVVVIGSRSNCRIHLISRSISRAHALLVQDGQQVYIRDLASRSGVLINDNAVREAVLRDRDVITLGSFTFQYSAGRALTPQREVAPTAPPAIVRCADGSSAVRLVDVPSTPEESRVVLIGRRDSSDIPLDDESVSTAHAAVFCINGYHAIRDLGSRTGTFVNGAAIHQQTLAPGDRIQIGPFQLRFALEEADEVETPAAADRVEEQPVEAAEGEPFAVIEPEAAVETEESAAAIDLEAPAVSEVAPSTPAAIAPSKIAPVAPEAPADLPPALPEPAAESVEAAAPKRRGWKLFSWGRRKEEKEEAATSEPEAEAVEPAVEEEPQPIELAPEDEAPPIEAAEAPALELLDEPAPIIEPAIAEHAELPTLELPIEPAPSKAPAAVEAELPAITTAEAPSVEVVGTPIELTDVAPEVPTIEPVPVGETELTPFDAAPALLPIEPPAIAIESPAVSEVEPPLELASTPEAPTAESTPADEAELLSLDLSLEAPPTEPSVVSADEPPAAVAELPAVAEFEPPAVAEPEAPEFIQPPSLDQVELSTGGKLESASARTVEPFELDQATQPPHDDGGVASVSEVIDIAEPAAPTAEEPPVEPMRFAERVPVSKTRVRPEPIATQLAETVSPTEPTPDSALPLIELGTDTTAETSTPFADSIGTLSDDDLAALTAEPPSITLSEATPTTSAGVAAPSAPRDVAELSKAVTEFAGSGLGELVIEPPESAAPEKAIESKPATEIEPVKVAAKAPTAIEPPPETEPKLPAPSVETPVPVVFPPMAPAPGRAVTPTVAPGTLGGFGGLQGGPSLLPAARDGSAPYVPPVVVPAVVKPPPAVTSPPPRRPVTAKGLAAIADEARIGGQRRVDETIPPFDPMRPSAVSPRSPRTPRGQIVPLFGSSRLAEPGAAAPGSPAKPLDAADVVKGLAPSTIDSRAFAGAVATTGQAPPPTALTPMALISDEDADRPATDDSAIAAALGAVPSTSILSSEAAESATAIRLRRLERGRISRRRLKRVWMCLAGAPLLAAVAAIGGWMLGPVHSIIEAHVVFTGLEMQNRHDRIQFQSTQLQHLSESSARSAAIQQLHRGEDAQMSPGFLDDPNEFYAVVSAGTFSADQPNTMILRRQGTDADGDRARLKAVVLWLYDLNAPLRDLAARASDKVRRLNDRIAEGARERDDLKREIDQLQPLTQSRPSPADLAAAEGQLAKLQQAYEDSRTARLRNEADIKHLTETGPTTAPGALASVIPATQPSDAELAALGRELTEVDRKAGEIRRTREADQKKARADLDAAMTQFQHQVDSAKQLTQTSPQLSAYIASAQQAFDSAHGIVNDFIHQQEQTYTALTDLRSRLNDKMDQRRAKLWAADKELKELNDRLEIAKRQYNAAIAGALTKESDDYKAQIELLTNMIRAREDLIPQDPVYADVVAQLQQLIDSQRKKLDENRATAQTAMDALASQLQQSHPSDVGLSQDQKALPAELEKRLADVNTARRRYADMSGSPDTDDAARKLADQRQQLLASMEARKNTLADAVSQQDRARGDQQRTAQLASLRQQHDKLVQAENEALAAFNQKDRDLAALRQRDTDGRAAEARLADLTAERARVQAGLDQDNRDIHPAKDDADQTIVQAPLNPESDLRITGTLDRRPLVALAAGGTAALFMLGMAGLNLLGMTRHVRNVDARAKRLRTIAPVPPDESIALAEIVSIPSEAMAGLDTSDYGVDAAEDNKAEPLEAIDEVEPISRRPADALDELDLEPIGEASVAEVQAPESTNGESTATHDHVTHATSEADLEAEDEFESDEPSTIEHAAPGAAEPALHLDLPRGETTEEASFLDALMSPDEPAPESQASDAAENGKADHPGRRLF